jgi:hypothetical protein
MDERGPALMQVMSHIIFLQRKNHLEPTRIVVNKEVEAVLAAYVATGAPLSRLFGVEIVTDSSATAVPFVVFIADKPSKLRKR